MSWEGKENDFSGSHTTYTAPSKQQQCSIASFRKLALEQHPKSRVTYSSFGEISCSEKDDAAIQIWTIFEVTTISASLLFSKKFWFYSTLADRKGTLRSKAESFIMKDTFPCDVRMKWAERKTTSFSLAESLGWIDTCNHIQHGNSLQHPKTQLD